MIPLISKKVHIIREKVVSLFSHIFSYSDMEMSSNDVKLHSHGARVTENGVFNRQNNGTVVNEFVIGISNKNLGNKFSGNRMLTVSQIEILSENGDCIDFPHKRTLRQKRIIVRDILRGYTFNRTQNDCNRENIQISSAKLFFFTRNIELKGMVEVEYAS